MDVVDLRDYYATPLGQRTQRFLSLAIARHLADGADLRIAGLGFAAPYLARYRAHAERVSALMPARQGVVNWPSGGPNAAALVDETCLPLPDAMLDRVVMVHALELSDRPLELLRETWRVLAPGGRLIVVVPNRVGVWARLDRTPFGHGRPYSRGQLQRLMREALFSPSGWSEALYFWPAQGRLVLQTAPFFERFGHGVAAMLGGVLIVEAVKQLYEGLPARSRSGERVLRPVLVPTAAARVRGARVANRVSDPS